MHLREIGWEVMDWIHVAQERDQWRAFMNMIKEHSGSIKCCEIL
jgi:hypothetical protein